MVVSVSGQMPMLYPPPPTCDFQQCDILTSVDPDEPGQLSFKLRNCKIVSEYDQEIPQSQTADNPMAPRGRAAQPSRDTRKTN